MFPPGRNVSNWVETFVTRVAIFSTWVEMFSTEWMEIFSPEHLMKKKVKMFRKKL
jgi:hypothetical protein